MAQLFSNNAASTLSGTLSVGGTTLVLSAGTGSLFPAPTGGDFALLTLFEKDESGNDTRIEVVKVTARTADTLTITRDYESMTGNAGGYGYPSELGKTVYVELRWTAAGATGLLQKIDNLSGLASAATARTNLGVAIGTNVQAYDAGLQSIAGLTTAADRMIYTTAPDTYAVATLTAAGRALLDDADAAAQRTTLSLGNVNNTSDADKPISTATQTALNAKAPLSDPAFTSRIRVTGSGAYLPASATIASSSGSTGGAEILSQGTGATAGASYVTFHRNSTFAAHFGIDTDNALKLGGWTLGAVSYKIFHEGTPLLVKAATALGYTTGAGGTVTQATDKTTAVTLNKPTGQITLAASALSAAASAEFTFNNSLIGTADTLVLSAYGFPSYETTCLEIGSGFAVVRITNRSVVSRSNAVVVNFTLIKGASS